MEGVFFLEKKRKKKKEKLEKIDFLLFGYVYSNITQDLGCFRRKKGNKG